MTLFRLGSFRLHSGGASDWKIDMDGLDDEDIAAIAMLGARMVGEFGDVIGIARGGLRLARAMLEYIKLDSPTILIVDDVLTTGRSMQVALDSPKIPIGTKVVGLVGFARGPCPPWVKAVFTYNGGD